MLFGKKIFNTILIISISFLSGCDGCKEIKRIKAGYGSNSYSFHPKSSQLSFVKDSIPNKTFLTVVDTISRRVNKHYFINYCFDGPHELVSDNKAIASALFVKDGVWQSKVIVLDLGRRIILYSFPMPSDCEIILIQKPEWSQKVYILFQMKYDKKTMLKTIDLSDETVSDTHILGDFYTKNALFAKELPYLIVDASENGKNLLIVYNVTSKKIVHTFDINVNFTEIKVSNKDIIYGLSQIPGNKKGKVLEYDLNKMSERCTIELEGELESLQEAGGFLYVIGKDLKRSNAQKKYWLYPRKLYKVDMEKCGVIDAIDWTQRNGRFVGYDNIRNEIFYSVIDSDNPSLWIISNPRLTLSKIKNIIR